MGTRIVNSRVEDGRLRRRKGQGARLRAEWSDVRIHEAFDMMTRQRVACHR